MFIISSNKMTEMPHVYPVLYFDSLKDVKLQKKRKRRIIPVFQTHSTPHREVCYVN